MYVIQRSEKLTSFDCEVCRTSFDHAVEYSVSGHHDVECPEFVGIMIICEQCFRTRRADVERGARSTLRAMARHCRQKLREIEVYLSQDIDWRDDDE